MSRSAIARTLGIQAGLAALTLAHLCAQEGGVAPPDRAAIERGTGLYASNCSFCHGSQGRGSGQAPSLARGQLFSQDPTGNAVAAIIREGRPSKGMPSFSGLPQQTITDIIAYLRSRVLEARGVVPETALLVGDANAGRAYFNGAGQCSTCHSPTRDLAGIGTKYTPLTLTVAFLTPAATKPVQVKVTLPSGQAISGNLRYLDGFVVSIDDTAGDYHSWYRDKVKSVDVSDPLAQHRAQLARYTDTDIHNLLAYLVTLK
ncbi:MAG TPA: c-type cytochrome [Bryobacteraceae bacterium]|jgi:mono/diheme cytochrome c family protein